MEVKQRDRQNRSSAIGSVSVIVPAHQAENQIGACLNGLMAAGFARDEIIIVDDGSRDATGDIARAAAVRVLVNGQARGPSRARNRGVNETDADVVVFIDADVVIHPGARERVMSHFSSDPTLSAVFGSYDDSPAAQRPVSRYRNLLHHFVHQNALQEAQTFWTGFGAVRREAFLAVGGLDPAWENIEDVEFGLRLIDADGRILLDRELLATHLKDWTLSSMLRTDFHGRAIPWTRLLMFRGARTGDLNTAAGHKLAALAVILVVMALLVSAFDPRALLAVAAGVMLFVLANSHFLRFLSERHGIAFALSSVPCHALHYTAAMSGFAWVVLTEAIPDRIRVARLGR